MEGRKLGVGLLALIAALLMLVSSASAHGTVKTAGTTDPEEATGPAGCVVHSETPSFVDQGEFSSSSSVADVIEVECNPEYAGEEEVTISDYELYKQCGGRLAWGAPYEASEITEDMTAGDLKKGGKLYHQNKKGGKNAKTDIAVESPDITVYTDNDGNATVALIGNDCTKGTSLITADLVNDLYETVTTQFMVEGPKTTTPGLTLIPQSETEDDYTSSVVTIAEVEFPPIYAEKYVDINSPQLYNRCTGPGSLKLLWIPPFGSNGYIGVGPDYPDQVQLDNDGNAFVVMVGSDSCAAGPSLVEASLEVKPYTTYTKVFNIEPPHETFAEGV